MNKNLKKIIAMASVLAITASVAPAINNVSAYADDLTVNTDDKVEAAEKLGKYTDDSIKTEGDFQYVVAQDQKFAKIVKYVGNNSNVVFPDTVGGKNVTEIDDDVFKDNGANVKTVTLPQYISNNGVSEKAFETCINLESINSGSSTAYKSEDGVLYTAALDTLVCFPQKKVVDKFTILPDVKKVGEKAFFNVKGIQAITFGAGLENIADSAFLGMSNLSSFYIKEKEFNSNYFVNDGILFKINNEKTATTTPGTASAKKVTLVKFPQSLGKSNYEIKTIKDQSASYYITSIGNYAFEGNEFLENVTLKNNEGNTDDPQVTYIGENAFKGCSKLKSLTIPSTVGTISDFAFDGCSSLENFNIPGEKLNLGNGVFNNCTNLKTISIEKANCGYTDKKGNKINYFTDKGVLYKTVAKQKTLVKCPNMTSTLDATTGTYEVSKDVEVIGDYAFQGNTKFKKIAMKPTQVKEIGESAFANCTELADITWSDSVLKLGQNSFEGCNALKSIELANSIKQVEKETFNNCESLESLTLSPELESFDVTALNGCKSLSKLKVNNVVNEIGKNFFTKDSVLYMKKDSSDQSTTEEALKQAILVKYPIGLQASEFEVPSGVTVIGPDAFKGCTANGGKLKKVKISSPAKTISMADEKSINPINGANIAPIYNKYYDDKDEKKIVLVFNDVFDDDCELVDNYNKVTSSNEYFEINGNQLNKVLVSNDGKVNIPSEITSIKKGAFDGVTIGTLIIPSTVTDMDINDINSKVANKEIGQIEFANNDRYVLENGVLKDKNAQAPIISKIEVDTATFATNYKVGSDLDLTNAKIKVTYSNNTIADVKLTADMVAGYDKNKVGDQTLTITYNNFTTTVKVTVQPKEPVTADNHGIFALGSLFTAAIAGTFLSRKKKNN